MAKSPRPLLKWMRIFFAACHPLPQDYEIMTSGRMSANTVTVYARPKGGRARKGGHKVLASAKDAAQESGDNKTAQWMSLWPIPHPVGCHLCMRAYPACPPYGRAYRVTVWQASLTEAIFLITRMFSMI